MNAAGKVAPTEMVEPAPDAAEAQASEVLLAVVGPALPVRISGVPAARLADSDRVKETGLLFATTEVTEVPADSDDAPNAYMPEVGWPVGALITTEVVPGPAVADLTTPTTVGTPEQEQSIITTTLVEAALVPVSLKP